MSTTTPQTKQTSLASPITTNLPASTAPAERTSSSSPSSPSAPSASVVPTSPSHPLEQASVAGSIPDQAAAAAAPPSETSENHGISTPPIPMVHIRALVISGDSHVFSFEPEMTVGRMKELIWSMWPSQWREPAQPPSPSFIRILHAGRVLSDDSTLTSNNLPAAIAPTIPTVIHISVRSFSIRAEDDPKKPSLLHPVGSRSRHGNDDEVGGCKCLIM